MAGNMPYYNAVTCEGHHCAKDCDFCEYRDEAMEFCQKLDECEDVPWAWLKSYVKEFLKDYKEEYSPKVLLDFFLQEARTAFINEVIENENDYIEVDDDHLEMGFDPYQGCYTDDC